MGIYCFFESVAQAAKKEAGYELCWWETGMVCERRYRVGEQWYNLRPDAALGLSHRTAAHTFLAGVGSRHDECARSGDQVCLVCTLHRLARVGKTVRAAASADLHCPRYRPGRANVACCSDQTGACFW